MTQDQHLWPFKNKNLVSNGQVCSNFHVNVSEICFKFLLLVQMFGETDGCTTRQSLHDAILGKIPLTMSTSVHQLLQNLVLTNLYFR